MGHRPNPIELFQFEEPQLIGGTILSYDPRDAKVGYIHSEAQEGNIYCRPGNLCQIIEIEGRLYFSLNHRLEIQPRPGEDVVLLLQRDGRQQPFAFRWTLASQWHACKLIQGERRRAS
jgi:hypothetical protein